MKHHDFRFSGHLGKLRKKLQKGIRENNWDSLMGSNISYPLPRDFWVDNAPISRCIEYGLSDYFPEGYQKGHLATLLRASLDTLSFQQSTACRAFIQELKGPRQGLSVWKDQGVAAAIGDIFSEDMVPSHCEYDAWGYGGKKPNLK